MMPPNYPKIYLQKPIRGFHQLLAEKSPVMLLAIGVVLGLFLVVLFTAKSSLLGLMAGAGTVIAYDAASKAKRPEELGLTGSIAIGMAFIGAIPGLLMLSGTAFASLMGKAGSLPVFRFTTWLICVALGFGLGVWFLRHGARYIDSVKQKLTLKSAVERNKKTDVREIHKFLPVPGDQYDPRKYFAESKGMFIGLDEFEKPVYISYDDWKVSHILLSGRTRSGKGVAAQILLSQAIQRKEFVVILDPKCDNYMPHIFREACIESGQPYHYLDLRPGSPSQINMLADADEETIENMLISAFSLAEKGDSADFYRLSDRRAAREVARYVADNPGVNPSEVFEKLERGWSEEAAGFHAAFKEMAELPAVNRADRNGISLPSMEQTGGCLYVVGDMANTRIIRMQRMLLSKLMMIAKKRDYLNNEVRQITVLADEFKVHISRPFMTSLGASAGWGLHSILAFQSLQDLADVPADLDKDVVKGGVMENCAIQLSYRIKDPDTAEWLARATGTILVDEETRELKKNIALAEVLDDDRKIKQSERFFIDENMLMNLPKSCGVMTAPTGLPRFCLTSPVPANRGNAAITPTVPPEDFAQYNKRSGLQIEDIEDVVVVTIDTHKDEDQRFKRNDARTPCSFEIPDIPG